jgi:ParB family chromosome partitioning protein
LEFKKMAKNSIDAYGASGKTNVLMFEPEKLHLVTDKTTRFTMSVSTCLSARNGAEHHGAGYLSRLSSGKTRNGLPVWLMVVSACVIPWRLISDWLNRVNHCWFLR